MKCSATLGLKGMILHCVFLSDAHPGPHETTMLWVSEYGNTELLELRVEWKPAELE